MPPARRPSGKVVIEVEGLNDLIRDLKAVSSETRLDRELAKTHRKAAQPMVREMRSRAPRGLTGNLSRSPRAATSASGAMIHVGDKNRVPYAGPINFGWPARNISPQEFIYSTIRDQREEFIEIYVDMMDDLLARAFPQGGL